MKLKKLEIEAEPSWSDNYGKYKASIEYESSKGKVEMLLDSKVSEALLVCIGETITAFAAKAAQEISDNLIASANASKAIADAPIENVSGTPSAV